MTTATITNRELAPLPALKKERVDPLVTALNEDLAAVAKVWHDLFARAVKARSEFETKMKAVHEARASDTDRLAQAYLDGKAGKAADRKAEDVAYAEAEVAHREAEALTLAANRQATVLYKTIRGDVGSDTKQAARDQIRKCAKELVEVATRGSDLELRIAELEGVIEAVEWSERDNVYGRFSMVNVRSSEAARAMNVAAALAAEKLGES